MMIHGATIYNEDIGISQDGEQKIRQIMTMLKAIAPAGDLSMKFLKSGRQYEALVWGKANDLTIGVYNRGPSLAHVLDTIYYRVKKQCLKACKSRVDARSKRSSPDKESLLAMTG